MAVKKKKKVVKKKPAVTWKPPSYDPGRIAEFVQQRYGALPDWRKKQLYEGFKAQGAEFGEDPTGVRTDGLIALTPEMRNRLPEGWGGDGVQNMGLAKPQYDATKFELGQSASGRYFLRPRNEFTGLSPEAVAQIRQMDQQTAAQQSVIRAAYNSAADSTARDAQMISASLKSIPTSSGSTPPSTAASTAAGVPGAMGETYQKTADAGAQNAAFQSVANVTGLRAQAENSALAYAQQAAATRASTLSAYRNAAAEAASEAAKSEDTLNARLRGQDMTLLGAQLRAGAQIGMNNADNATSIANTTQNNNRAVTVARTNAQVQIARINSQLDIARQNNDTRRSIALLKEKSRILRDNDPNKIAERTLKQVQSVVPNQVDAEGNPVGIPVARQRKQFVQMMVAQGVTRRQAIALSRIYIKDR